jgi:glycine/D-amino acid oxidase-like deaminating enzyme
VSVPAARRAVVVGGGVFGVTAALELAQRGHRVTLVERGRIPNPLAASTDISKVCRMEYGADVAYTELMEEARGGWAVWNEERRQQGEEALFHETGVLMMSLDRMEAGGFEHDSYVTLRSRGYEPVRLDGRALSDRFGAWSATLGDGFFHRLGGWAASGEAVA